MKPLDINSVLGSLNSLRNSKNAASFKYTIDGLKTSISTVVAEAKKSIDTSQIQIAKEAIAKLSVNLGDRDVKSQYKIPDEESIASYTVKLKTAESIFSNNASLDTEIETIKSKNTSLRSKIDLAIDDATKIAESINDISKNISNIEDTIKAKLAKFTPEFVAFLQEVVQRAPQLKGNISSVILTILQKINNGAPIEDLADFTEKLQKLNNEKTSEKSELTKDGESLAENLTIATGFVNSLRLNEEELSASLSAQTKLGDTITQEVESMTQLDKYYTAFANGETAETFVNKNFGVTEAMPSSDEYSSTPLIETPATTSPSTAPSSSESNGTKDESNDRSSGSTFEEKTASVTPLPAPADDLSESHSVAAESVSSPAEGTPDVAAPSSEAVDERTIENSSNAEKVAIPEFDLTTKPQSVPAIIAKLNRPFEVEYATEGLDDIDIFFNIKKPLNLISEAKLTGKFINEMTIEERASKQYHVEKFFFSNYIDKINYKPSIDLPAMSAVINREQFTGLVLPQEHHPFKGLTYKEVLFIKSAISLAGELFIIKRYQTALHENAELMNILQTKDQPFTKPQQATLTSLYASHIGLLKGPIIVGADCTICYSSASKEKYVENGCAVAPGKYLALTRTGSNLEKNKSYFLNLKSENILNKLISQDDGSIYAGTTFDDAAKIASETLKSFCEGKYSYFGSERGMGEIVIGDGVVVNEICLYTKDNSLDYSVV